MFKKAERTQLWLRLALMGSTKGGKSYTGLKLLTYLVPNGRIAAIDTENGRLRLYAPAPGQAADPEAGTFDFDSIELDTYDPDLYIKAIHAAIEAGYSGLLIDSLSHAWAGEGGILEQKTAMDARGGNGYTNWGVMSKKQNRLIETALEAPLHLVVTMRAKMDYVIEQNERGKNEVRKLGLAPVQRNDTEYEFDVLGMMESGSMRVIGSRCSALPEGTVLAKPGQELASTLHSWLGLGGTLPMTKPQFIEKLKAQGWDTARMVALVNGHPELTGATKWDQLYTLAVGEGA